MASSNISIIIICHVGASGDNSWPWVWMRILLFRNHWNIPAVLFSMEVKHVLPGLREWGRKEISIFCASKVRQVLYMQQLLHLTAFLLTTAYGYSCPSVSPMLGNWSLGKLNNPCKVIPRVTRKYSDMSKKCKRWEVYRR